MRPGVSSTSWLFEPLRDLINLSAAFFFSVWRKKESGLSVVSKWLTFALIFAPSWIESRRAFFSASRLLIKVSFKVGLVLWSWSISAFIERNLSLRPLAILMECVMMSLLKASLQESRQSTLVSHAGLLIRVAQRCLKSSKKWGSSRMRVLHFQYPLPLTLGNFNVSRTTLWSLKVLKVCSILQPFSIRVLSI